MLTTAFVSSVFIAAAWAGAAGPARTAVGAFTWARGLGLPQQGVPADTGRYRPSRRPKVRTRDRAGSRFSPQRRRSPLVLPLPKSVQLNVTPDDSSKRYQVRETVGNEVDYRDPTEISREELLRFRERQAISDYYRLKSQGGVTGLGAQPGSAQAQRLIPKIDLGPVADRIFGGRYIDMRPAGALTLKLGWRQNVNRNPALTLRQQSVGDFIFDQNLNLNLSGTVGTKLKLTFNYDTKAAFDFDNQMKFDYAGQPTDILRKLDLGNVSMPLNNSLITGGSNLFGIKTQLQFGRLGVTAVAATLRGSADEVRVQNGAQSRTFELKASQYERDRHYFLSQYFRDNYDQNLRSLPTVQSGITITRLEVYVTNDNRTTDNLRNVVALQDLAEPREERIYRPQFYNPATAATAKTPARNIANNLYGSLIGPGATRDNLTVEQYLGNLPTPRGTVNLVKNLDYERIRARKMATTEYTFNAQLGYLNLNTALLPDQVLGVSYSYIYNGKTYTVGETVNEYGTKVDQNQVIFLKLLKATNPGVGTANPAVNPANPNLATGNTPTWDLMMKNIYSLNASQLNRDNFNLQIIYKDDATGVDLISLKDGSRIINTPLIQVFGLDRVNANNDRNADGNFDYFPGVTIDPELGKIIFPSVQPFGSYLQGQFDPNVPADVALIPKYVYSELYNQTQSDAQQVQTKDKFFLRGRFQGAAGADEISLPGIGVAQGSVKVYSGSTLLTEGVDYQVFYDQAKVKILNTAYLNAANELRVAFEKNALVQVQPRKLLGTRLDYALNKDALFGFTAMHILENQAPGINRVNIGDEPANNTVLGADLSFRKDSRVLTKLVDMLPIVSTKEISTVSFTGEVAKLIAGKSQLGRGEDGVSYIDDFENARTPYTLSGLASVPAWRLAATPAPILGTATGLATNFQRGKLAWYTVDQSYYTGGSAVSANITTATINNHYSRGIQRNEIFPRKDLGATGNGFEYSFDLAYFPNERGPYNYSPNVSADGRHFTNSSNTPLGLQRRYAGVSRAITFDTDFDNANVEYLEFWLMDPFIKGANGLAAALNSDPSTANPAGVPYTDDTVGGQLILNLGNVSEDVLKDSNRHEFENGLPTPADTNPAQLIDNTDWGVVTTQQFVTDAFSGAAGARAVQDVGLEGLDNPAEQAFYNPSRAPGPFSTLNDPSGDDFRHHLDPTFDQDRTQIIGRYKDYDNYQGNSPENSQLSSTAYPDKEDLNRDNVVQDSENYYEYAMSLRPGNLNIGQNYIIDKVEAPVNGTSGTGSTEIVTWYQFRIPVREPTGVQGQPIGFKNIRFMRMYLTGWQQPVVLRMVQPQFVANQWRRYLTRITDPALTVGQTTIDATAFNISTVSLEENGLSNGGGIPYVQPPGIVRDVEYGSTAVSRQQNEQSLRLCVENLTDGYAKAAYKNITINLLRYKRLRMYLHADSQDPNTASGDVRGFIRIGTDYTQNYYQYSLPLQLTTVASGAIPTADDVWPEANRIDVAFQDFIDAKSARNIALAQGVPGVGLNIPFDVTLPNGGTITIVGNPDFSAVQGCMIGMLNPAATTDNADKRAKTLCMWADELRVFDFETQGGWAANARLNVKLADVANITATGSFIGVGFGGLQDKAQARSTSDVVRGDLNATVAVDKFLPPALRLKVPVLVQASTQTITPQYDPLDPDTKLEQSLRKFQTADAKAEYQKLVVDRTTSRSLSVLNVRKERGPNQTKVHPWDIENVAVSYAITERTHSDINTREDYSRSYTAALAYVYQTTPRSFTPFSTLKVLDNPYLKIFKEVNFSPLPSRFSFRMDLDRRYNQRFLQRVLEPGTLPTAVNEGVFYKAFYVNRVYDLRWDIFKSLALDYTANNRGVVDEGAGASIGDSPTAQANRELLRKNLLLGGRTTNFDQTIAATYRLPLDKFPLTDWLSADVRYSAHYTWQAASTALRAPNPSPSRLPDGTVDPTDTTTVAINLGNTIQNNAEFTANGKIDLVKLYNKVKFLNIINNAPAKPRPRPARPDLNAPAGTRLPQAPAAPDTAQKDPLRFVKAALRAIMTARSINFTYAHSNGTLLPGYLPKTRFFGLTGNSLRDLAPGIPFILGQQYDLHDLYQEAVYRDWYTLNSQYLNTGLSSLLTDNISARTTLEPFRGFNIQLDARWQRTKNDESYYRRTIDTASTAYRDVGYLQSINYTTKDAVAYIQPQIVGSGTFSTTTVTIQTMFGDLGANGETSKAFDRFVLNRRAVQERLQAASPAFLSTTGSSAGTTVGLYSYNSQEVLIQSFLDAYHGKSSDGYEAKKFNPFGVIPLPNWRIEYTSFADLPGIRELFRSFTINHAYSSVYTLGSYTKNTQYSGEPDFSSNSPLIPLQSNATGQYVPFYVVSQVSFLESLTPLLGVNFQTVNNVTGRLQYSTSRAVALNTTNYQVTELHTSDITIGLGYAATGLKLPFRVGGEQRTLKNNLQARLDLSIRDNKTIQRSIIGSTDSIPSVTGSSTPAARGNVGTSTALITNGALTVQLRPTIDYLLNSRLNLQFYFTQTITQPRVSNAFRNSTSEGGLQLRYSLQ